VEQKRLLRRQTPGVAKALAQIGGAEVPEAGIPRRALPGQFVRPRRDVPSLHDLSQESALEQALTMNAGEIGRPDRNGPFLLKGLENF